MKIYKYSSTEELMQLLDASQPVYVDTETSKLGSQIRLIQIYQESWEQVLIFNTDTIKAYHVWVILTPYHLVGHNFIYDMNCFKVDGPEGIYTHPKNWDDTFYLSRLAFPDWNTGKGYSLDTALTNVMGYDPYAKLGLNKKQLQMSFERIMVKKEYVEGAEGLKVITDEQLLYGAVDVYELPKLYKAVKHMKDHYVYKLDIDVIATIMKDSRGMPVDLDRLDELEQADISNVAHIKQSIGTLNVNSYMQVRKQLGTVLSSDEMALRIIENREGGLTDLWTRITMTNGKWAKAVINGLDAGTIQVRTASFGKYTLLASSIQLPTNKKILVYAKESDYEHTQAKVELATKINATRKSLKRLNFVKRAHVAMDEDNRISATFSPHAINGRIQQDNENLTQFPRAMKKMWGFKPGSGRKLIYSDFAQIELRIICAALPEMNMYKALKDGKDLHSFVAEQFNFTPSEIAKLPAGQNPRQVAKQANFLLLYGGGATNFQRVVCRNSGVWFEDETSLGIVTKWKDIFSDIKEWHHNNSKSTTKRDKTVMGREYKASLVTDLNNIKVSGTGSEVFKLWLVYIDKYIVQRYSDVFVLNRVHDSVTLDVVDDPDVYKPIAILLTKLAQKAWFNTIANAALTDVPMPADATVGNNMGEIDGSGENIDFTYTLDPYYMLDKEIEDEL